MSVHSEIFACRNPELWLITAMASTGCGEKATVDVSASGMIATSVTSVSIVPEAPRVLVAISHQHRTGEIINQCGAFALHVLGEDNLDLVWRFGLQSGHAVEKLAEIKTRRHSIDFESARINFLVVPDCAAWLACRVETLFDIGDRLLVVAEVVAAEKLRHRMDPLTMRRLAEIGAPEKLSQLREQSSRQAVIDHQAITNWRLSNGSLVNRDATRPNE
ncbi:MAG: flavin reductase family protein [Pirellulales bacterium]|nr:flavin reductase family protein [Pirellulales bacterium]